MNEINSLSWYAPLIGIVSGVALVAGFMVIVSVSLELANNIVTKGRWGFFSAVDAAVVDIRYQTVGLVLAFTFLYGFGFVFGWIRTWILVLLIGPPFFVSTLRFVRRQVRKRRGRTTCRSRDLDKFCGGFAVDSNEPTSLTSWYRFLDWFTQAKPVTGYVMAAVGFVLAYNEVAGQEQATFAALDPYAAALMVWSLAAFVISFHDYENTHGGRRVLATVGVLLAGLAVIIVVLQVLIVVLFAVAVPLLQKKGRQW